MNNHPFIFSDLPKYRILRHLLFWGFWWIFQAILYSFIVRDPTQTYVERLRITLFEAFVFLGPQIFLAYSLIYFIIPRFLLRQRYLLTGFLTIIAFLITAWLSWIFRNFLINPILVHFTDAVPQVINNTNACYTEKNKLPPGVPGKDYTINSTLLAGLRGSIITGGIAAAIKLMKYWYVKEQRNLQLQKENVEIQLQVLTAQVHPHFLFNTLNNIYSYTQQTSPIAAGLITDLSEILRYVLYEGNKRYVSLAQELKMIANYIELEKVRYGNKLEIHVKIPEKTDDLYITPLLLLPLVENTFKHGASNFLENPWITLEITLQDTLMHMKLINGKMDAKDVASAKSSGIGIANVKRRLELLYENKHELHIINEEDVFILNLKIYLKRIDENAKPDIDA